MSAGSTRDGFGKALLELGKSFSRVVVLTADLAESTRVLEFANEHPDRFFDVGVAEQNLVTVASGLAHVGFVPFATSFAAFSPGRNWEQIRTTICYNNQNVKIVGCHAGLGVGEDGATHQILEDISLMRTLPGMTVVVPADSHQAYLATLAIAAQKGPCYLRLARHATEQVTPADFVLGKNQVILEGKDLTILSSGPLLAEVVLAAKFLAKLGISAEVQNVHTIKPLDVKSIVSSSKKTKVVVTVEDHQITGGLGGAVAEVLSEHYQVPLLRLGMRDAFGGSGKAEELYKHYGLSAKEIASACKKWHDHCKR